MGGGGGSYIHGHVSFFFFNVKEMSLVMSLISVLVMFIKSCESCVTSLDL